MRRLVPTVLAFACAAFAQERAHDEAATPLTQQQLADQIDQALAAEWNGQKLEPAAPVADAGWLRRLSLDLCGSIPGRDEVAEFLGDATPDKRSRKIDEYLRDPRLAENLSFIWSNLLLASAGKDADVTRPWLRPWIEGQFRQGVPYRDIVHRMVADADATPDPGSTSYLLSYRDATETIAGVTARTFLGLQIQCAQCHDHPFDQWKQSDFNQFAAFFLDMRADHVPNGRKGNPLFRVLDVGPAVDLKDRLYRILIAMRGKGGDGDTMAGGDAAAGADGGAMAGSATDNTMVSDVMSGSSSGAATNKPTTEESLAALTDLIRFCRRSENGLKGGLEQLDADPEQLNELTAQLPPDARDLLRRYQDRRAMFGTARFLDGTPYEPKEGVTRRAALADWMTGADNPWFAKAAVNRLWKLLFGKGLTEPVDDLSAKDDRVLPELLDRLAIEFSRHDTDVRFLLGALARTRAYALSDSSIADEAERDRVERRFCSHLPRSFTPEQMTESLLRATTSEEVAWKRRVGAADPARARLLDEMVVYFGAKGGGNDGYAANIPQSLFLMNGGYTDRGETLHRGAQYAAFADVTHSAIDRLRPLFLTTLGRPPTDAEAARLVALADGRGVAAGFDDLFWSLLNSTEFHTNH